ncbi:helix-turn-helix transcriptional regulator [Sutcliffiella horikoshii]|uniref:helix-turn-helix domain-containing protein n=1 Tax=Sutcliffiella horikoshii TaxID=79883 RepID=UPI00203EE085|nr:helix-turn-helix transcriptional regulator [Sutcliffiella horikoshii]
MNVNVIAQHRKKQNISQTDFARKVGMDRSYLNKIEQGKLIPSIKLLKIIAEELKVPVRDFF